ncbi:MAG: hypothetical protein KBT33_13385 [Prevotellaceae bacterium]|nr:hypothetical protein [Candidatus Minthosoma equi]
MKTSRILFFLFAVLFCINTNAQNDTISIRGQVRFKSEPAEACIVAMLNPKDSALVSYAVTDERGAYSMRFISHASELLMRVTGFNVKRQMKRIAARSQTLNLTVEEEDMVLREVQIKAQKLWGSRDTLNYLVSAYTKEHDRTIGDVLRQLPGITIDNDGTIKYQGTPINHFYIENLDMLQGRYGLATNGIKAEDVATVQVLENHEHIKALQDQVPPESAAINLKLKEKAKGVWTKSADLGAGAYGNGMLWDETLQAMYFGKGGQHMLRYSGDNSGSGMDAAKSHYGVSASGEGSMMGVIGHGSSPVGNSFFDYRHGVNMNNIAKLADDATLNYNLNYRHNFARGESYASTTYIMPDGTNILLTEEIADHSHTDAADLQLTYEKNAEKRFLNNTLSLAGQWDEGRGTIHSSENISQAMHYRSLALKNKTQWIHRTDNGGGFEWTSTNSISTSPQKLIIGEDMTAMQRVGITHLATSNQFETLRNLRAHRWTIAVTGHINSDYTALTSHLNHPDAPTSPEGELHHIYTHAGIGPMFRYVNKNFRTTLNLPIALTHTWFQNADEGNDTPPLGTGVLHFRWQPSFSLLWKANDYFSFDANAHYGASETPWRHLLTASIMNNYRSLSRYRAKLSDMHSAGANFKVSFKDILGGFFAYLNGGWNRSWSDVAFGTTLDEQAHSVIEAANMPNHNQSFSLTLNGRKDIDWHDIQIEANATASKGESDILRQSILSSYHSNSYNLSGRLSFDIVEGYRLEYSARWNSHDSSSEGYQYTYKDWSQNAKLHLRLLPSRLFLNVSANHTHNSSFASAQKDYVFVGAGLKFFMSKKLEFNLNADNITNLHTFTSHSVNDMMQSHVIYQLRPWSVMLMAHVAL